MKKSASIILTIALTFSSISINGRANAANDTREPISLGTVTIQNLDSLTKKPIVNSQFRIVDAKTNQVLETVKTNEKGIAVSKELVYSKKYKLIQTKVKSPYELNKKSSLVVLKAKNLAVKKLNHVHEYVKKYQRTSKGNIVINKVKIPVGTVYQKPQLPNGCEITSLTAVLNYHHYHVTKTKMSDTYLPKKPFSYYRSKRYGPNPYTYFVGNPRYQSGFFCFAPPIVTAANRYLRAVKSKYHAVDLSNSSSSQLLKQLKKGIPVVTWITLDLSRPIIGYGWYLYNTGHYFRAPINLHAVVLTGYDEKYVYVMNPLRGKVAYYRSSFFNSYYAMGKHAVAIIPK